MREDREGDAAVERLVAFLSREGAASEPSARAGHSVLRSSKGAMLVADQVVDALRKQGVLSRRDGRVVVTAERRSGASRIASVPVQSDSDSAPMLIDLAESPLSLLASRRGPDGRAFLAPDEVAAGERLRADYTRAQLMPSLGVNWDVSASRGGSRISRTDLNDSAIDARSRVEEAIDAVGPELAGVLVDICCFLKGMEQVERERRWPVRSAKLMLKAALGALARHYSPKRRAVRPTILAWGAQGYRPTVGGEP